MGSGNLSKLCLGPNQCSWQNYLFRKDCRQFTNNLEEQCSFKSGFFTSLLWVFTHMYMLYVDLFLINGKIISYSYYLSLQIWIWLMFCISTIVQWITLWSTSFILCNVFKAPLWYALTKTSSIFFLTTEEYCTIWLPSQDQLPLGLTKSRSVISWCSFPFS